MEGNFGKGLKLSVSRLRRCRDEWAAGLGYVRGRRS